MRWSLYAVFSFDCDRPSEYVARFPATTQARLGGSVPNAIPLAPLDKRSRLAINEYPPITRRVALLLTRRCPATVCRPSVLQTLVAFTARVVAAVFLSVNRHMFRPFPHVRQKGSKVGQPPFANARTLGAVLFPNLTGSASAASNYPGPDMPRLGLIAATCVSVFGVTSWCILDPPAPTRHDTTTAQVGCRCNVDVATIASTLPPRGAAASADTVRSVNHTQYTKATILPANSVYSFRHRYLFHGGGQAGGGETPPGTFNTRTLAHPRYPLFLALATLLVLTSCIKTRIGPHDTPVVDGVKAPSRDGGSE